MNKLMYLILGILLIATPISVFAIRDLSDDYRLDWNGWPWRNYLFQDLFTAKDSSGFIVSNFQCANANDNGIQYFCHYSNMNPRWNDWSNFTYLKICYKSVPDYRYGFMINIRGSGNLYTPYLLNSTSAEKCNLFNLRNDFKATDSNLTHVAYIKTGGACSGNMSQKIHMYLLQDKDVCQDDCSLSNIKCINNMDYVTCGNFDTDACLDWSTTTSSCAFGSTCINNSCVLTCHNKCFAGDKKCSNPNNYVVCADYNNDGCTEWGTPQKCDKNLKCINGQCIRKK